MWVDLNLLINRFQYSIEKILRNLGFLSSHQLLKVALFTTLLFLFMSTSCNARTLSKEEVANFMLNAYATQNGDVNQANLVESVASHMGTWQTIADLTSQYEGKYSIGYNYRTKTFFFVYYTGSTNALNNQYTTSVMFSNNNAYIGRYSSMANNLSLTYNYYNYKLDTDNLTNSTVTNGSVNNTCFGYSNTNIYWVYTDRYISYSTSWGISAHGQKPTGIDLFAENYISSEVWQFTPSWANTVNLSGDTTVDYYVVDPSYIYTIMGTLKDASLCTGAAYDILAYNKSINTWESVLSWGEYFTSSDPISNYFDTGLIDNVSTSIIKLRSNIVIPDTIITFYFNKGNEISDLNNRLKCSFYVRGSHSVLTNNIIDYDNTFSDPNYYKEYQDNVNELVSMSFNDTINDVNENINNNSEVPELVNSYFGTSGDLLEKLGYQVTDNPYYDIIYNIFISVKNILLSNESISFDIVVKGQRWGTISSNDFIIPNGELRLFISGLLIFLLIRLVIKFFFMNFQNIVEGDIKPVLHFVKGHVRDIANFF